MRIIVSANSTVKIVIEVLKNCHRVEIVIGLSCLEGGWFAPCCLPFYRLRSTEAVRDDDNDNESFLEFHV